MHFIGRIDKRIYSCITEDISTDRVVITDRQIEHSNLHDYSFDRYKLYLRDILAAPKYIFEDKRPNTGLVIHPLIDTDGRYIQIVLRIKVTSDPAGYANSIISCWTINESRLRNYLRNRKLLYNRDKV